MSLSALGEPVTIVNRVRTATGEPVPYDAHVDGDCITIRDQITVPAGIARIIVQGSVYALDPRVDLAERQFRLGVAEWGLPVDTLVEADVKAAEAVLEDEKLHQYDRTTKGGHKYIGTRRPVHLARRDPLELSMPGPRQDGAFPGGYGEAATRI